MILRQEAEILKGQGNGEMAKIYEKAAKAAEATIAPPQQQQPQRRPTGPQPGGQGRPQGVRPEVIPPNTGMESPEEAPLE